MESIIIDNASTDGSDLLNLKNEKIRIIKNSENIGFAAACNLGASYARADILLFLNPDTILNAYSLNDSVSFYVNNASRMGFGILGIKLLNQNWQNQISCSKFPTLTSEFFDRTGLAKIFPHLSFHLNNFDHNSSCFVDQVMGAFFMISAKLFNQLEGFDNRFFVYYEEVDLSYRAKQLGYKTYFYAEASAIHIGGGCSHQIKAARLFYSIRSRIFYINKHFSIFSKWLLLILALLVEPLSRIVFCLLKRNTLGAKEVICGYKMLYSWLVKQ